jgi:hypothetical protein
MGLRSLDLKSAILKPLEMIIIIICFCVVHLAILR